MTAKEKREIIAKVNFCRSFLYLNDFLSDAEKENVHHRIRKWQDKYNVVITDAQLISVDMTYKDDTKEVLL